MNTLESKAIDFTEHRFPYGLLCEFAQVKDKTARTWLNRYFPEMGKKQKNKKMLFSGLECISLRIFSYLVTNLAIQPETAKVITVTGLSYITELVATRGIDYKQKVFLVINNADKSNLDYQLLGGKEINSLFDKEIVQPVTIVPFDIALIYAWGRLLNIRENYKALRNRIGMPPDKPMSWE